MKGTNMGNKIYTRTGTITPTRDPESYRHGARDFDVRIYRFPLKENPLQEIRVNVPTGATKADMLEALEHMRVCADFME